MTDHSTGEDMRPGQTGEESGIDVVLVTGLSGAGRGGTAAKVLEDLAGTSPTICRPNSSPEWWTSV